MNQSPIQQCIFSGTLNRLTDSLHVPATYQEARDLSDSIYNALTDVDKWFPTFGQDLVTSLLSDAQYTDVTPSFDLVRWHKDLTDALRYKAEDLDRLVSWGAYDPAVLNQIVSEARPVTWREYLSVTDCVVGEDSDVRLYCNRYSNCGYIYVRGFVFKAHGYHMFNLYNRFSAERYNWNNL